MATYAILTNYTREGLQVVKAGPDRWEGAGPLFEKLGIQVKAHYWLMGPYDGLTIIEAPDAETASRFALAVGMQGNGQTTTMRAFSVDEFKQVVAGLPG